MALNFLHLATSRPIASVQYIKAALTGTIESLVILIFCIYLATLHFPLIGPLIWLWNMHDAFLALCCSSCRVSSPCFAAAICLLSMNSASSQPLGFILLRVSVAPPPLPIWIFFHCIHFCAFKKSPRITNLEESEKQSERGGFRTRKENKQGRTGHLYSSMRVNPFWRMAAMG